MNIFRHKRQTWVDSQNLQRKKYEHVENRLKSSLLEKLQKDEPSKDCGPYLLGSSCLTPKLRWSYLFKSYAQLIIYKKLVLIIAIFSCLWSITYIGCICYPYLVQSIVGKSLSDLWIKGQILSYRRKVYYRVSQKKHINRFAKNFSFELNFSNFGCNQTFS